jgi:hypothetical protein
VVQRLPGRDAIIHWSNQGPTPYDYFDYWMDNNLSAPSGKPAGGDYGWFDNPQVQAALAQYAGTDSTAAQQQALDTLEGIVSTQAPVIPLLYGAAWYEYSIKDYTGWPTATNQYIDPVPNSPYPGPAFSARAGQAGVPRGAAHRLPGLRSGRETAALPVRPRPGLHHMGIRVCRGRFPRRRAGETRPVPAS